MGDHEQPAADCLRSTVRSCCSCVRNCMDAVICKSLSWFPSNSTSRELNSASLLGSPNILLLCRSKVRNLVQGAGIVTSLELLPIAMWLRQRVSRYRRLDRHDQSKLYTRSVLQTACQVVGGQVTVSPATHWMHVNLAR